MRMGIMAIFSPHFPSALHSAWNIVHAQLIYVERMSE